MFYKEFLYFLLQIHEWHSFKQLARGSKKRFLRRTRMREKDESKKIWLLTLEERKRNCFEKGNYDNWNDGDGRIIQDWCENENDGTFLQEKVSEKVCLLILFFGFHYLHFSTTTQTFLRKSKPWHRYRNLCLSYKTTSEIVSRLYASIMQKITVVFLVSKTVSNTQTCKGGSNVSFFSCMKALPLTRGTFLLITSN